MGLHHLLLVIHIICATIWVGGHLIMVIGFLPKALKLKNFDIVASVEKVYEPIGMPSLILLIITGILMSYDFGVTVQTWFHFNTSFEKTISLKIIGVLLTFAFALSAQTRLLPKLHKGDNSKIVQMAVHMICVTTLALIILFLGSLIRIGGIDALFL